MIIVTPKINPDLDGYACAYAYSEFLNKTGKKTLGIALGYPQKEVEFLSEEFKIPGLPSDRKDIKKANQFILVDSSSLKGLPSGIDPKKIIEVIDHREVHKAREEFPNAKIQIAKVGAAATLIGERFKKRGIQISRESAILLYGAIASNSLNFQVSFVSQKDKTIFNWLAKRTDIPKNLIQRMFLNKSQFNDQTFTQTIVGDFKEVDINDKLIGIAQLEVVGLKEILGKRKQQLFDIFDRLKKKKGLDFIFLTAVDLEKGYNLFVTNHEPTKKFLKSKLNLSFNNQGFAQRPGVILRKEITPILKK
jgi:inorganic pyrophosphatase/exopolyphosphatase